MDTLSKQEKRRYMLSRALPKFRYDKLSGWDFSWFDLSVQKEKRYYRCTGYFIHLGSGLEDCKILNYPNLLYTYPVRGKEIPIGFTYCFKNWEPSHTDIKRLDNFNSKEMKQS